MMVEREQWLTAREFQDAVAATTSAMETGVPGKSYAGAPCVVERAEPMKPRATSGA